MLKSIAVAAVVAGTAVMSAGVSADEGATCVVDGGSTGWLFSSEAGTVTLAEVIVPDGWRASVSVTVENNVGDVDEPYHDAPPIPLKNSSLSLETETARQIASIECAKNKELQKYHYQDSQRC